MICSIEIKNFKSVVDLKPESGRFNVLIGANGCGKSNILESIAFAAAACANKPDYEFLGSRGIRLTQPEFMFSAFEDTSLVDVISISVLHQKTDYSYQLKNVSGSQKQWTDINAGNIRNLYTEATCEVMDDRKYIPLIKQENKNEPNGGQKAYYTVLKKLSKKKEIINCSQYNCGFLQFVTHLDTIEA